MAIGILFLAGGISNVFMLPSPMWFNCVDLIGLSQWHYWVENMEPGLNLILAFCYQ